MLSSQEIWFIYTGRWDRNRITNRELAVSDDEKIISRYTYVFIEHLQVHILCFLVKCRLIIELLLQ